MCIRDSLYYLSMEFLMGRLLGDTVCNMRLNEVLDLSLIHI